MKLSDVCENITDGKHGDCEPQENSGFYFISCKDIKNNTIDFGNARQITEKDYIDAHKRTQFEKDDILITNSGTIGRMCYVDEELMKKRVTFQKSVAILKPNKEKINPQYLYYYLDRKMPILKKKAHGTSQKNLLLVDLRNYSIELPDTQTQNQIVFKLTQFDEKIRLNKKIILDLEEYAQLLFYKWFIEFKFQDSKFNNGSLERIGDKLIPIGWRNAHLTSIADYQNGLAMQKYRPISDDFLPVIKIRELKQGYTDEESELCDIDIKESAKVSDGDVIFSWSASLFVDIWNGGDAGLNQHLFKVTSKEYPKWFYYFWTKRHLNKFIQIASGKKTTMGHINRKHLEQAVVVIPSEDHINSMSEMMEPIFNKITLLKKENLLLKETRDTLIKKLIK